MDEVSTKEVQISTRESTRGKKLYFSILEGLKQGLRPSQICVKLGIKKQKLSYYLSSLKAQKVIKKIGYGVWQVDNQKEVQISTRVATTAQKLYFSKPDTVRGHGFVFRFELPRGLRNWDKREELLTHAKITFNRLNIFGGGQSLNFKGRKVWLTNKSIIVYEQESFIADLAKDSQSKALHHFLELLRSLERHLQANFEISKSRFKVSRQHYALIKNALARQYNEEGKKLECYTGEGLWLLIDDSLKLNELETVHPVSGVRDNEKVQDFFNGIKKLEGFTPEFVTNSLGQTMQVQMHLDKNLKTHFEVLGKIADAVTELKEAVKELKK